MNKMTAAAIAGLAALTLAGCSTDADVVSENLSKEADSFNIMRRVVFYNGITDKYMLTIEGKCSLNADDHRLEVTCKTGENPDTYKKHFLGLSDNVTYISEQLDGVNVDRFHYKVIFKPEVIIPDVDRP